MSHYEDIDELFKVVRNQERRINELVERTESLERRLNEQGLEALPETEEELIGV